MVKKIKNYKNFNILTSHKKSIVLVGNFDGLHLGHQKLFNLAQRYKKKYKLKIGVVTFEPMPKMYFNKSIKNFRISNLKQKNIILQNLGIDFVVTKKFDKKFSNIKSDTFIKDILYKKLNAKYIFVSNNFRFGNKREGDVKQLIHSEKVFNFKIIKPKPLVQKNKVISSTLIRKLLINGDLDKANKLLNRKWCIEGIVEKGRQQGKKIGFPTCNIDIKDYVIAMPGVYAVRIDLKDKKFSIIKSDFFIKEILSKKLEAKYIFVSNNFRFGNKREGNVRQLIKNEKIYDYKIVKPQPSILNNKVISSTYIRSLLEKGSLKKTNKLLGRNWSIEGMVQKGRQQGKKIGFPTCNIDIKDYVIAMPGVFAVKIKRKNSNKYLKGIANLGYRPTFNQKKILLEVHIFNFSGNLYNKYLSVEFIKFIRKERKFKNINQLRKQIQSDLKVAKYN